MKLIETNSNLGNVELASRNIYKCKSLKKDIGISCKINGLNNAATLININLEVLPEEEALLKYGPNIEVFYTMHGDTEKQNNLLVSLAIERIKRLVEQNKHVVVLVNDITKLIKYQNFSLGNQSNDVKYKSLDSVCKLLTLARFIDENKSVTLLCFFKNQVFANNSILIEDEFDNLNCNVIDFN